MTASGQLRFLVPRDKDGAWRESATCRFTKPEMFFPAGDSDPDDQIVQQAKAMCRVCPVREDCLLSRSKQSRWMASGVAPPRTSGDGCDEPG